MVLIYSVAQGCVVSVSAERGAGRGESRQAQVRGGPCGDHPGGPGPGLGRETRGSEMGLGVLKEVQGGKGTSPSAGHAILLGMEARPSQCAEDEAWAEKQEGGGGGRDRMELSGLGGR